MPRPRTPLARHHHHLLTQSRITSMAQTLSIPGTYPKAMVHVRDGLEQWHYSIRIWHKTGLSGIWCVEDAEWCAFHAGCFSGATMGDLSLGHAHLASSVYSYIMTARHLNGHTIRIDLNQSASQIALAVGRRYSINGTASTSSRMTSLSICTPSRS